MYSAYLVCADYEPARQGMVRLEPDNSPLPASADPSKDGWNEPRGAPAFAPKHKFGALTTPRSPGRQARRSA